MNVIKSWEDLEFKDDFIFGKVMQDPDLCRQMLERILDISIDHIEYPEIQKSIDLDLESKGIRLDVYVKDGQGTVYNVEMQALNRDDLRKRSRYYQALIDMDLLEKEENYSTMNRSFVIFICNFDLFSQGRYRYTFENICQEDHNLRLGDGTVKIFLNAAGSKGKVSPELKSFLSYVRNRKVEEDSFVRKLDKAVQQAKENRKWRSEYMKLFLIKQDMKREGRIEGRIEGRAEGETMKLISQTRKKINKGISDEEIADILEEDIELIRKLSAMIKKFPQKSDEEICELYQESQKGGQDTEVRDY